MADHGQMKQRVTEIMESEPRVTETTGSKMTDGGREGDYCTEKLQL